MNRQGLIVTILVASALLAWQAGHSSSQGCAVVHRQEASVAIAEESAIILWDAANKTQDFIRWASFATQTPDFGFLVPTPTQPLLAEVADSAFAFLEELIKPRSVRQFGISSFCLSSVSCTKHRVETKSAAVKTEVRVLDEQRVGGFDAVVLEADNAEALNQWLNHYGYVADPELTPWLEPYVKNNWKITAFKIVQDPKTGKPVKTAPVRMTFTTEKPFFPYREPRATRHDASFNRLLRIFFVSDQKVAGRLGEAAWSARVHWADQLETGQGRQLARELGFKEKSPISNRSWLTTFHDTAWSRPGDADVYFEPAAVQDSIRPPDVIEPFIIPLELILGGAILLFMFMMGRFKRKVG